MDFPRFLRVLRYLFGCFKIVACSLSLTLNRINWGGTSVHNVRLEQIGYLPDVVGLEFFAVDGGVHLKVEIKEILGPIILIHPYIFELEFDSDVVIGKEG